MTSNDIERIEKFIDTFELSMDDIFSLLGIGVCRMEVRAIIQENKEMTSLFCKMDDYIYNDMLAHIGDIQNDM